MHDGLRDPRRDQPHRTTHRSNVPRDGARVGISKDGLRDGLTENPHEVLRDRDREAYLLSAGHSGLHRDGMGRHSAALAHRSSTKRLEESRSKPVTTSVTAQYRLSSDSQPLAGQAGADARLGSGLKPEAKLSTKVVHTIIVLLSYILPVKPISQLRFDYDTTTTKN